MAQTDKLRKAKSLFATTLVTGIGTGTGDTITLNSASGLPTDTEITLTLNRIDSSGKPNSTSVIERITGTIVGSALTSYTRGVDGTTEQAHAGSTVVEYIWNADDWNDAVDAFLVEHGQDGKHTALTATSADIAGASRIGTSLTVEGTGSSGAILRLTEDTDNGTNYMGIQAPAAVTTSKTLILPDGDGSANQVLKTDGSANLGWATVRTKGNVCIQVYDGADSLTTGDGKAYFTVPTELNGMNLIAVHARVITAGTTNTTAIQIANVTDTVDMLSTKLTIDTTETGSDTAATAAVIDTTKDDVATNDLLRIDIDQVSTTAPKGLIVRLEFGF